MRSRHIHLHCLIMAAYVSVLRTTCLTVWKICSSPNQLLQLQPDDFTRGCHDSSAEATWRVQYHRALHLNSLHLYEAERCKKLGYSVEYQQRGIASKRDKKKTRERNTQHVVTAAAILGNWQSYLREDSKQGRAVQVIVLRFYQWLNEKDNSLLSPIQRKLCSNLRWMIRDCSILASMRKPCLVRLAQAVERCGSQSKGPGFKSWRRWWDSSVRQTANGPLKPHESIETSVSIPQRSI